MKLTQDLMQLFVEYQVPSDLLSYDGETAGSSVKEKVDNVKHHVAAVMQVVDSAKEKQLGEEKQKAEMAMSRAYVEFAEEVDLSRDTGPPPAGYSFGMSNSFGGRDRSLGSSPDKGVKMKRTATRLRQSGSLSGSFRPPPVQQPSSEAMVYRSSARPLDSLESSESMAVRPSAPAKTTNTKERDGAPAEKTNTVQRDGGSQENKAEGTTNDFTAMPKILDSLVEVHDKEGSLRSTVIKTADAWTRCRQENLLSKSSVQTLTSASIGSEKNKAFDLLDALCRSGSLPIDCGELHVMICLTHRFENDVLGTIIKDNINPIEKLEKSSLLLASAIHAVSPKQVVRDQETLNRLSSVFPLLLEG